MTLVEVTAWWDTMTVNFGDGEKPTVVAAIMTKVKQIVDSIEGFTADADEVLNAPIYREALVGGPIIWDCVCGAFQLFLSRSRGKPKFSSIWVEKRLKNG
jgi:hypothetical protein